MFISHLPAGYMMTRHFAKKRENRNCLILTGLCASILPDLDLLWFYLIDNRQHAHHGYLFHMPLFWVILAVSAFAFARLMRWRQAEPFIFVTLAGLLLHMVLDSIAAEIAWFRPFSTYEVNLVHVPRRYEWWVWNFVLHWTFLLEIGIVVAAATTFWRDVRVRHKRPAG